VKKEKQITELHIRNLKIKEKRAEEKRDRKRLQKYIG
jgi:hypothetical protein